MTTNPKLRDQLVRKYRGEAPDLDPAVLERIIDDVSASVGKGAPATGDSPFAVSWMDSFLAHWMFGQQVKPEVDRLDEVAPLLRDLMDARFADRAEAIREWIGRLAEPPDGGTPEPGVPPVGPVAMEPPDGGPPEPGVPPVGPSVMEPPDGGPPEPGVPPVGPVAGLEGENPWILYWFVSLKLPMLVDVLDAHLERRLAELGFDQR